MARTCGKLKTNNLATLLFRVFPTKDFGNVGDTPINIQSFRYVLKGNLIVIIGKEPTNYTIWTKALPVHILYNIHNQWRRKTHYLPKNKTMRKRDSLYNHLSKAEAIKMEMDFEQGIYEDWIDRFPKRYVKEIFGMFMHPRQDFPLTYEFIRFCQSRGLDLNEPNEFYEGCDSGWSNALHAACEWRNPEWVDMFLRAGSDPNYLIEELSPYDALIMGHSWSPYPPMDKIEECGKWLELAGATREVADFVKNTTRPDSQIRAFLHEFSVRKTSRCDEMDL